ncbi:MAG: homocysteine S-methyltransferase family protein, partial [Gemmatimonadaceae bacterium]
MTARRDVREVLDPERIIIFDGAMGTMLYAKGVFINQCYDELNVRAPELVRDVHHAYTKAGAEVLETNSFGANRLKLAPYGLEERVEELNRAAARIARDTAGQGVLVAGAVGPLGVRLEPFGPVGRDEARGLFRDQMSALRDGGVDLFILETFSDLDEIEQAVRAARDVDAALPVIAQMTIGPDGLTPYGATPEDVAHALDAAGADIIGLNCSVGPQTILEAIERMAAVTRRKLSAQPNAGMPRDVGGRTMYMASPEYVANYGRHLIQAGAKVLGGCCGTTPDHIKALVEGIRPLVPRQQWRASVRYQLPHTDDAAVTRAEQRPADGEPAVPFAERSRWAAKIARGEFVSSVEIVPPRGVDATRMLDGVRALRDRGVDAVNVPDGPRAQSR